LVCRRVGLSASCPVTPGTFRNVFCVRVGKRYVRLWRSQRSRTVVWGG